MITVVKPLHIGKIKLKNNLILAPMAGITDLPFRLIAKEGGASLVCTEMVSANALSHADKKTFKMLKLSKDEHPVSVQIFGSKPQMMKEAAKVVEDNGADIVDINCGCPVNKVVKTGAGARMLENEKLMLENIESVASAVKIPVTVKMRIGLNKNENLAPALVEKIQGLNVAAIIIHARSAEFHHSGKPDLEALKEAVKVSKIPIIGNGGIEDEKTAKEFLQLTGCHGLMIGRAAVEDPWIFSRIWHYLQTGDVLEVPSWEQRMQYLKKHAKMAVEYYGEKMGMLKLRKIAPYYLKGLPNACKIRQKFNKIHTLNEIDEVFEIARRSSSFE